MNLYKLTYADDLCDEDTDTPFRFIAHKLTGHRWPMLRGWVLTDAEDYVIAVNQALYADTGCQEARAWAANELYTHTGQLPGPWTDTGVFEETIQFTTEGAAEWTGAQLADLHDRAERADEALLTIACADDVKVARRIAAEAFTASAAQPTCGLCHHVPVNPDEAWCVDCLENDDPANYDIAGVRRDDI